MEGLAIASLIVSIIAICIAIYAIWQAIQIRNQTRQESLDDINFIANLIMYSSTNPENVANKLQEYRKTGSWGEVEVIRKPDGKLNFKFSKNLSGKIGLSGKLEAHVIKPDSKTI